MPALMFAIIVETLIVPYARDWRDVTVSCTCAGAIAGIFPAILVSPDAALLAYPGLFFGAAFGFVRLTCTRVWSGSWVRGESTQENRWRRTMRPAAHS